MKFYTNGPKCLHFACISSLILSIPSHLYGFTVPHDTDYCITQKHTAQSQTSDYTVYTPTGRDRTRAAAHAARVVWPSGLDARANVPGHSSRTRLTRLVSLVGPLPHPCTWLTYGRFTKFMLDCSCRAHLFFCCTQRTRSKCDGWRAWDHLVRNEPSSQSVGAA